MSDDEGPGVGIASRGIYFKNLSSAESTSAEFPPYRRVSFTSKGLLSPTMCFYCGGMEAKGWAELVELGQATVTFQLKG